ncbi:sigma 54-interacting transcriptional regulator [Aquabacterium sp. A7-Y]|uniref:sigma-54 interaction domain-containing protein n=1 Tax=Aquabacterium sp. A7-Y TaxID=1349605 RepID=UPI00223E467A|nr:sigma 54-interacting transcriptional regulator [Aquabacterium sp. A7-Y]MCW7538911.1 sigma 54-interacting transcriptional regulator [Aquabacterium sp. A7-Y]
MWAVAADVARCSGHPALRASSVQSFFNAFERASQGTLVVDREARIAWISARHAQRFGIADARQVLGRPCEEVIPNSRMREVVDTGQPILLDILDAPGQPLVVTRLPLQAEDGSVVGAVGFTLFEEWAVLSPLVSRFLHLQEQLAAARKARSVTRQAKYRLSDFVGVSAATLELKRTARRAAASGSPVLLLGETGTGKELLAHAIHAASPRAHRAFVSLSMAAIPDNLLEAELFGVAPGAYTGADRRERQGKLQVAHGGTLFLDEIGDMPLGLQAKLLRVLQEKEFEPLGSNEVLCADVRIIAATSRPLAELVARGAFRADLYYRLDVLSIAVPPLRDRIEDLQPICSAVLDSLAEQQGGRPCEVRPEALALLARQRWPGNIRELRNVLERCLVLSDSRVLTAASVRAALHSAGPGDTTPSPEPPALPAPEGLDAQSYQGAMEHYERQLIEQALAESRSVAAAAKRLGMGRATLYRKMAAYGLGRWQLLPQEAGGSEGGVKEGEGRGE